MELSKNQILVLLLCLVSTTVDGTSEDIHIDQTNLTLSKCPPVSVCSVCHFEAHRLDLQCENLGTNRSGILVPLFEEVSNLTSKLRFQKSGLTYLPVGICLLTDLKLLDISKNQLKWSAIEKISCLKNLTTLLADNNLIKKVEPELFEDIRQLKAISLQHNKISEFDSYNILKPLQKIRYVMLAYNELHEVDVGAFKLPSVLNSNNSDNILFNLSFNKIEKLTNYYDFHLKDLPIHKPLVSVGVDLRQNKLRYLRNFNLGTLFHSEEWADYLRLWDCDFYIMGNPFDCDCDMYNFLYPIREIIHRFINLFDIMLLDVKCASPPEAAGKTIVDVFNSSVQDFRCFINKSCVDGFTCEYRPGIETMIVTLANHSIVTEMPKAVPSATNIELHLSGSRIKHLENHGYLRNVTTLDISNSELNQIEAKAIEHLTGAKKLYFYNSNLTSAPSIMGKLENVSWEVVYFADNPFFCDCHLGWLKQFIKHSTFVKDFINVKCSNGNLLGRRVIEVRNYEFACNYKDGNYFTLKIILYCICCIALTLSVTTIIVHSKLRYIQMKYLKAFNKKLRFGKPKKMTKIEYGICFLYNELDLECVEEVAQITAGYKSFFQHRDMEHGRNSRDEMLEAMELSSCIIPVISKSALKDWELGVYFRRGFDLFMEYEDKILIPILLNPVEELLSTPNVDKDLKYFLNLHCVTYINYQTGNKRQFANSLLQELNEQHVQRQVELENM